MATQRPEPGRRLGPAHTQRFSRLSRSVLIPPGLTGLWLEGGGRRCCWICSSFPLCGASWRRFISRPFPLLAERKLRRLWVRNCCCRRSERSDGPES